MYLSVPNQEHMKRIRLLRAFLSEFIVVLTSLCLRAEILEQVVFIYREITLFV